MMARINTELLSWWLFLVSATFFVIDAARNGSTLGVIASVTFFGAVALYLAGAHLGGER